MRVCSRSGDRHATGLRYLWGTIDYCPCGMKGVQCMMVEDELGVLIRKHERKRIKEYYLSADDVFAEGLNRGCTGKS